MKPKRRRAIAAVVLLLLTALGFQMGRLTERYLPLLEPAKAQPTFPAAERIVGLSTIWEQAKYNYPFWHRLEGLDWDKAYSEYLPRALAARDDLAYYRVLEEFMALLKDGHSTGPAGRPWWSGPARRCCRRSTSPLPGGGIGRVLTKWDTLPNGAEFVGAGIAPDVLVEPTAAEIAAGRDPVLEKAKELLGLTAR